MYFLRQPSPVSFGKQKPVYIPDIIALLYFLIYDFKIPHYNSRVANPIKLNLMLLSNQNGQ